MIQASLPLNYSINYRAEALVVGKCNQEIVKFIKSWSVLPSNRFVAFTGEKGSGKTHLLHALGVYAKGLWLQKNCLQISPRDIISQNQLYILDDADQVQDFNWLFDFYNVILEKNAFWTISGRNPVKSWSNELKDWQSRLISFLSFHLELPDDEIMAKVLTKQLYDRGLIIDDLTIKYLLCRIDRSFTSIQNIATILDQASAKQQRRLTIPLLKEILGNPSPQTIMDM